MTNVSLKNERSLRTTVGGLARDFDLPAEGPVIILIGAAMAEAEVRRPQAADVRHLRSEPYFLEA